MSEDSFVLEMCGNKSAWQIHVDGIDKIDLESVGANIEAAGYTIGIKTRLVWTFSGPAESIDIPRMLRELRSLVISHLQVCAQPPGNC